LNDTLSIHVFGGIVKRGEHEIRLTPREFEVLAFFALASGAIEARTAAGRIWPECSDEQSINVFHVTMARLRKKLGSGILERVHTGYRVPPAVEVDVRRLEESVRSFRCGQGVATTAALDALAHAIAAPMAAPLTAREWFAPLGARLDSLRATLFDTLGRAWIEAGSFENAIAFADEITRVDAEDERGYALAIQAHLRSGNELAAQRILRNWRRVCGETPAADLKAYL
jgi:DNA-binding SARP family transcriptional activator